MLLDFSKSGMTYQWQDGSTEPIFLVSTSGIYSVLIEKCDQSVFREVEVTVEDCPCRLEIPNAFTPDADGVNDYFKILYECPITDFQMEIYNHWGALFLAAPMRNLVGMAQKTGKYFLSMFTYINTTVGWMLNWYRNMEILV